MTEHDLDDGRACLLVTGPPGAGKSSVARAVAQRLRRAAVLDGDVVNELIVAGRVWALGEPAEEAARQVRLCNANLCALAANFADHEITPVVDWVIPDRAQLDFFLDTLAPRRVLLVVLAPSAEVCAARNAARDLDDQFFFDGHDTLLAAMRDGFGGVGAWLDTSDLSFEQTADLVVSEVSRRR